jgi:hypothetical protein
MEELFCADISRDNQEGLLGTASFYTHLFLLECNEDRATNPLKDSNLIPEKVKEFLSIKLKGLPNSRLLLIKRINKGSKLVFSYYYNEPSVASHNEIELSSYEGLLDINFAEFITNKATATNRLLVCTNSQKDKCCGKYGIPLYKYYASKLSSEEVRECSHIWGDRFAPNLIWLPYNIYFGRIVLNEMDSFLSAIQRQQISLKNYRGKAYLQSFIQAAEYFLLMQHEDKSVGRFTFISSEKSENHFTSIFHDNIEREELQVIVTISPTNFESFLSCENTQKSSPKSFKLVSITKI